MWMRNRNRQQLAIKRENVPHEVTDLTSSFSHCDVTLSLVRKLQVKSRGITGFSMLSSKYMSAKFNPSKSSLKDASLELF